MDSGASEHFTFSRKDLVDYEKVQGSMKVQTASTSLEIEGQGSVFISCYVGNKKKTIRLYPVYYISGFKARLLSLGRFLQDGHTMTGDLKGITLMIMLDI